MNIYTHVRGESSIALDFLKPCYYHEDFGALLDRILQGVTMCNRILVCWWYTCVLLNMSLR